MFFSRICICCFLFRWPQRSCRVQNLSHRSFSSSAAMGCTCNRPQLVGISRSREVLQAGLVFLLSLVVSCQRVNTFTSFSLFLFFFLFYDFFFPLINFFNPIFTQPLAKWVVGNYITTISFRTKWLFFFRFVFPSAAAVYQHLINFCVKWGETAQCYNKLKVPYYVKSTLPMFSNNNVSVACQ